MRTLKGDTYKVQSHSLVGAGDFAASGTTETHQSRYDAGAAAQVSRATQYGFKFSGVQK